MKFEYTDDTHIVIKRKDLELALNQDDIEILYSMLNVIAEYRRDKGKKGHNSYLVVNCDEPYANEVFGVIAKNEFMKEEREAELQAVVLEFIGDDEEENDD